MVIIVTCLWINQPISCYSNIWKLGVDLSRGEEHQYRYCVVVILNSETLYSEAQGRQKKVIVRRWETHLIPR